MVRCVGVGGDGCVVWACRGCVMILMRSCVDQSRSRPAEDRRKILYKEDEGDASGIKRKFEEATLAKTMMITETDETPIYYIQTKVFNQLLYSITVSPKQKKIFRALKIIYHNIIKRRKIPHELERVPRLSHNHPDSHTKPKHTNNDLPYHTLSKTFLHSHPPLCAEDTFAKYVACRPMYSIGG